MDEFIELVGIDGFEAGTMREVDVDDHHVLVARVGDQFYAADGRCPHMGGHLANGVLEGTIVTCPRHGSQFDLSDGRCLRWTDWSGAVKTMAELVKHPRPLRVYDLRVEGDRLLIGAQKTPPAQ
jgi:3-phenylpropionate/trans-cinnamate dioxygenase ferredoxin subunit